MITAILPELMTITVFILSILTIMAGSKPGYLQNYEVLYLNVTGLKTAHHTNTSEMLPIHDVYNLHLTTQCAGELMSIFWSIFLYLRYFTRLCFSDVSNSLQYQC